MGIRPLGDRVVLTRLEAKKTAKGGIVIPDTAKENSMQAKVVVVGSGRLTDAGTRIPVEVDCGDEVLVRRYAGTEIEVSGKEYLVVGEDEILAVLSRSKTRSKKEARS